MIHEKLRVGWFMQCPACGMTFILTTPADCVVDQRARVLKRNPTGHKGEPVTLVRCPDCLSGNVRLTEIGDGK